MLSHFPGFPVEMGTTKTVTNKNNQPQLHLSYWKRTPRSEYKTANIMFLLSICHLRFNPGNIKAYRFHINLIFQQKGYALLNKDIAPPIFVESKQFGQINSFTTDDNKDNL